MAAGLAAGLVTAYAMQRVAQTELAVATVCETAAAAGQAAAVDEGGTAGDAAAAAGEVAARAASEAGEPAASIVALATSTTVNGCHGHGRVSGADRTVCRSRHWRRGCTGGHNGTER